MRTVVVGPGAVGCLFAALLTERANDVRLLDKSADRARAISLKGIRIEGIGGERSVRVPATADPAELGTAEFVCICVKSYDTAEAVTRALPIMGPDTAVVSFQNGLGNAEQIVRLAGSVSVICANTGHGSTNLGEGHVRHAGSGVTRAAPFTRRSTQAALGFVGILRSSGIETEFLADADSLVWSKLIVNAAINPVTAVWNVQNGCLLDRADLRKTWTGAAREAERVAAAKGVSLLFEDAISQVEQVCRQTQANVSSMLQDVRHRKRTEIHAISGAIVNEARALGTPVPVTESLLQRVLEIEAGAKASRHS